MSGLLDPKTRVLDTIITQEGRGQMSVGKLRAEYVSFSDAGAVYNLDTLISGGLDFTSRLCFEAGNLPQDMVVFEADDSGKLLGNFVSGSEAFKVAAGQIFSGSTREERGSLTGSQFASMSEKLLASSIDNFKKLFILSSPEPFDERYDQFLIGPTDIPFTITPNRPISSKDLQKISIDHAESLFYDKRLSHVPNFKFLPPVNKARPGETATRPLGFYVNLNQKSLATFDDVAQELNYIASIGYEQRVLFTETSKQNNLLCQFFELANGEMTKLDVIDFGKFPPDKNGSTKQVFFVGKVFTDGFNVTTFVNLFTLVFSS